MKHLLIAIGTVVFLSGASRADLFHSPKFKSPGGQYEVIFASAGAASIPFVKTSLHIPAGQKLQYVLLFYVYGASDPVSADWYTDAEPPRPPEQIMTSLIWSPQEDYVVVTHGQNTQAAKSLRWLISMKNSFAYGFEGDHLTWVDARRLVGDLQTKKVPGGIELIDAPKHHAELLISPDSGRGYLLASVGDPLVTVKEYLNHWGDERDKTTWDYFEPGCFELNLDTLKKRSVACPK